MTPVTPNACFPRSQNPNRITAHLHKIHRAWPQPCEPAGSLVPNIIHHLQRKTPKTVCYIKHLQRPHTTHTLLPYRAYLMFSIRRKKKPFTFKILKQVHTSSSTKKKNKEISPFCAPRGYTTYIRDKDRR